MFNTGDKVICIDISNMDYIDYDYKLIYGDIYNVSNYLCAFPTSICIKINNTDIIYASSRFISLKNYRKQKLNKLKK